MAGRPRKRAREAAPVSVPTPFGTSARPVLELDNDGNVVGATDPVTGEPVPVPASFAELAVGVHGATSVPTHTEPTNDREYLAQWWRDRVEAIEASGAERRAAIAVAADQGHPSALFERQARVFGALGIPIDVAAMLLEVTQTDFGLYYGRAYTVGSAEAIMPVAQNLLRIAMSSNDRVAVKAAVEVMNRRGGEEWRPPAQKLEVSDDRTKRDNVIDSRSLSYDDRRALEAIIRRSVGRGGEIAQTGVAGEIGDESECA
jgi:hypothetical protein